MREYMKEKMSFEMTEENKTLSIVNRTLLSLFLLVGMAWLPAANAEVVASLGDVGLDADAVMRLLEQNEDAAVVLSKEQQRDLIFQNLLRKYLAKQAEEAGLPDQPEVAERIRVLAEETRLYTAYLRSVVPVPTLTTAQVIDPYRGNLEALQRPESISLNQILLTQATYGSDVDEAIARVEEAKQAGGLDFADISDDLGLSAESQRDAALERTVAVADLLPSVREALDGAAVGDAVGPIALDQGVAYVQLNERLPAGPRAFDEVEDFIRDRASTTLRNALETAYVDELMEANPIKFNGERSWNGWLDGERLPRRPEKRVIAEMGSVEYSLGELLAFVEVLKTTGINQQQLTEPEYLREQVVKTRMVRKFLIEQAKEIGFDEQPRVKAMVAEARRVILADIWLAQLIEEAVTVPEQSVIDDFYQRNIADYQVPAQVNISQLLIEAGNETDAIAAEFVRSIRAGESGFNDGAQQLSNESGDATSTFTEGWALISDIPSDVFEQIAGLSGGDVSAPIKIAGGIIVIQINQVESASVIPLEQIQERVASEYVTQQQSAERNEILSELKNALKF